jgi:hypothetical protein
MLTLNFNLRSYYYIINLKWQDTAKAIAVFNTILHYVKCKM